MMSFTSNVAESSVYIGNFCNLNNINLDYTIKLNKTVVLFIWKLNSLLKYPVGINEKWYNVAIVMTIELIRLQIDLFCSSNSGIYILFSPVRNRVAILWRCQFLKCSFIALYYNLHRWYSKSYYKHWITEINEY
jgi:hypothetical protein